MATPGPKASFAKVAAAKTENKTTPNSALTKTYTPGTAQPAAMSGPVIANGDNGRAYASLRIQEAQRQKAGPVDKIASAMNDLTLAQKAPSLVVNGSGLAGADRSRAMVSRESGSDESQRADSGSDLGTKPPSLDGKSITSGTTFALDEKESLRPDDSASVKAAAEDDDALSIRGSLIAGSRMGSDVAAARGRGMLLGEISEKRFAQPPPGANIHGILTLQSASSGQPPGSGPQIPLEAVGESSDAIDVIYRQAPDEKLLEALATPRDRYFLLRLEKDVIDFVQNSKEPYMDLPPSNSFCRMLTHKLADYYHMTHSYEPQVGSVRIFRTPFCRVPPPLAQMQPNLVPSASSTPPPAVLPKKIMRRGEDGEPATASASPSKPTSEIGSDGKEKNALANQKLTREEREELYKLARERIFGSSEEGKADAEADNEMSRASSVSATNRSNVGKRGKTAKQRRDDSDSFDSRHQYTPYWGPQQPTWMPQQQQPQFMPPQNPQMTPMGPPTYMAQMPPAMGQPNPGYGGSPVMVPNTAYTGFPVPQFPPQAPPQYPASGSPMATYGAPIPPNGPPPSWQPGFNPGPYPLQQRGPMPTGPQPQVQGGIPYAYGQLPTNVSPHDPKSQHPIPGSYNRNHSFNPKTQSFVPGSTGMPPPVQPPQPPFTAPGSHHGSPPIGSPHAAFPSYQQPMPQPYGAGYGMARQPSNSSMPSYHPPQQAIPQHHSQIPPMANVQHGPPIQQKQLPPPPPPNQGQRGPNRPNPQQGQNQIFSHLPNYGNPATLPQKPATGI